MESDVHLRQQLRKLKLSGILDSLEQRILDCRQNDIDYKSFLSLLLEDEIELRFARRVERLIQQAGFGAEKTLESFDMTLAPGLNKTLVRELSTCTFIARSEAILLTGPPGTGKTHLAKAFGHAACRKDHTVSFLKFNALFSQFGRANRLDKLDTLIDKLARIDLLIIDDFAFRRIGQQSSEWLYEIVDR